MNEIDIFQDITGHFVFRVKHHDDEAAITLKGHLLSEYLLDRIIDAKLAESKRSKNLTYSKKLVLLERRCLLPNVILLNLRLLNSFRNRLVHELDATVEKDEMVFYKPEGKIAIIKPKKGRYPQRNYLKLLCFGTLTQLRNHMSRVLKVDPRKQSMFA